MSEEGNVVTETREFFTVRRRQNERKKSLTEEMGTALASFVDKTELNKTAVGIGLRLDRLSADKRADVLRSLDAIREHMSGVWAQEETQSMDFGTEGATTGLAAGQEAARKRRSKPDTEPKKTAKQRAKDDAAAEAEMKRIREQAEADARQDAADYPPEPEAEPFTGEIEPATPHLRAV